jgi:hypothetical protein
MALSASAAFADAILWECRKTIMLRREFISLLAAATASNAPAKSSGKAQMGLSFEGIYLWRDV